MSKKDKGDRVAMLREQANARKIAKSLGREMLEEDDSDAAEPDSDEDDFFKKSSINKTNRFGNQEIAL